MASIYSGQVGGLREKRGYQVFWCDEHLMIFKLIILRKTLSNYVAIRFMSVEMVFSLVVVVELVVAGLVVVELVVVMVVIVVIMALVLVLVLVVVPGW